MKEVIARSDSMLTLPTSVQMRGKGKKGSEIIEIFQHRQIEIGINARKGSNTISSVAITDSVNEASYTILNQLDHADSETKETY